MLVVNRPQGLRDMNEKVYTAWFPDCCAPTLITRDMDGMQAFLAEHGRIVCKPLHGMGGRSIFVIAEGDKNARVVFESHDGLRRALCDGAALPARDRRRPAMRASCSWTASPCRMSLVRMPAAVGSSRQPGGRRERRRAAPCPIATAGSCSRIGPVMRERGMLFVGLDVIGGFVTEINVTSPTGIRELETQYGHDIAGSLIDAVLARVSAAAEPASRSCRRAAQVPTTGCS